MSLSVQNLVIEIDGRRVVDGISFEVPDGARLGLIGESGSGKSLTALAVLGLLPDGATASGSIRWRGTELIGMPDRALARLRGDDIGIVFQEPRTALNPIRTVGRQIAESIRIHEGLGRREARARAIVHGPRILVGDEPLSALDVTVRAQILALLIELRQTTDLTLVLVSHDIGVVQNLCDTVVVMKDGHIVERGSTSDVLLHPTQDYTKALLSAIPVIPGTPGR